jgi:protein involved in polysaccharide export with SLBB domain
MAPGELLQRPQQLASSSGESWDVSPEDIYQECPDGTFSMDCPSKLGHVPSQPLGLRPSSGRNVPGKQYKGGDEDRPQPTYQVTEPANEFQQFVQSTTGHLLPIYGSSLFERVPSTFSPLDRVPVATDYTLGPGDEIDLRTWGQVNFNQRLTVDRTGDVFIPQVGRVNLAGAKFDQLHDTIQLAISRVYRNFDISVNMGQLRSIQVFVVGQARRPGSYTVSSLSTLVNALFASGGPSHRGSLRNILLKRGGNVVASFDLYELLLRGDMTKDVRLMPGDIIFIPYANPRVAVDGSIGAPAIYEMKGDTSLGDVLNFAGGLSQTASAGAAILDRVDQHATLQSDSINLTPEGLNTRIQDGDIVRILPVVPRFTRTVALRGNVADPVRLPWHPGMKVSDLIPNKETLLTRGYWNAHNELLKRVPGEATYKDRQSKANADISLAAATVEDTSVIRDFPRRNDVQPSAPDINWNYATIERLDPQDLTTHLISFNLAKAVIERDPAVDAALEPDDVVTVFSLADITVPRLQQTRYVRVEGEVALAGVYAVLPGETLRDIVARAGGLTPNAYLYGAQLTRESTRKEQENRLSAFLDQFERDMDQALASTPSTPNLASAGQVAATQASVANEQSLIQRLRQTPVTGRIVLDLQPESAGIDALPALPLENGDIFLVPSTPSTVNVLGSVYNQGSFLYSVNLHLGDYLAQTGGPSRYADRSHLFVIRADGSVIGKESRSRLFSNNFDSLSMYPGDTVVVPTFVRRRTVLSGFAEWSQVIGGFGLTAAAVNALR